MNRYLILLLLVFAVGCSKSGGAGHVFLDTNGDNVRQIGEEGLSGISYKVTKDGADHASGITSADGLLLFDIPEKGYYCIEVKPATASQTSTEVGTKDTSVKTTAYKNMSSEGGICTVDTDCAAGLSCQNAICSKYGTVKLGGTCGSNDDCATGLACSSGKCATVGEGSECDNDSECSSGLVCIDSECVNSDTPEAPAQAEVVESLKTCKNATSRELTLTADVPVKVEFEKTLAQIPAPAAIEASIDVPFTVEFYYPCSCKPSNITLPQNITSSGNDASKKDSNGLLDISPLLQQSKTVKTSNSDITNDKLCKVKTSLLITGTTSTTESAQLLPKAVCPNGKTISMKEQSIKWTKPKIEINQYTEAIDGTPWGKTITLVTAIKNYKAVKANDEATGKLAMTLPAGSTNVEIETSDTILCQPMFLDVKCDIPPSDESPVIIRFKFPTCEEALKMAPSTVFTIKSAFQPADSEEKTETGVTVIAMPGEC